MISVNVQTVPSHQFAFGNGGVDALSDGGLHELGHVLQNVLVSQWLPSAGGCHDATPSSNATLASRASLVASAAPFFRETLR